MGFVLVRCFLIFIAFELLPVVKKCRYKEMKEGIILLLVNIVAKVCDGNGKGSGSK